MVEQALGWKKWATAGAMIVLIAAGFAGGYWLSSSLDTSGYSAGEVILVLLGALAVLLLTQWAQVILHEAGHLVFGLLTGYRFSSFRIGSLMLVRQKDRLRLRLFSLTGTGGQCLLAPPPFQDGNYPVTAYLMGGVIMNLLTVVIAGVLWLCLPAREAHPVLEAVLILIAATGLIMAVMNGIPMRDSMLENDGKTTLALRKDADSRRAFWVQLSIGDRISQGQRLRDLQDEWFLLTPAQAKKSSQTAALAVLACQRMLDEGRFEEAEQAMEKLLNGGVPVLGVHRWLLFYDRVYCCLISGQTEKAARIYESIPAKVRRSLAGMLSVLRTEYALALLKTGDRKRAEELRSHFVRICRTHPYPIEVQSECELLDLAAERGWYPAES